MRRSLAGVCTLIGTSTNLVVNGMVLDRYGAGDSPLAVGLGMFDIGMLGVPCAVVGITFVVLFGSRLLPDRRTLDEMFENPREYTLELQVSERSALAGRSIENAGLRQLPGAFLARAGSRRSGAFGRVTSGGAAGGRPADLRGQHRLDAANCGTSRAWSPFPDQLFKLDAPRHQRCLVEAVVSDTCPLIGKTIREGRFRNVYNAVVIAVARNGERLQGKIGDMRLRPGDTLLIESHAGFVPRQKDSRDFYLVSGVENSSPRRFERAPLALRDPDLAMVLLAATGWLDMLTAALLAAAAMLLTGCCSPAQARRSVEWHVLLVIAAALGVGTALDKTGAASAIAGVMLGLVRDHPWLVLAMVYLVTTSFTEIITNNGAAALVFPIAMSTAERMERESDALHRLHHGRPPQPALPRRSATKRI